MAARFHFYGALVAVATMLGASSAMAQQGAWVCSAQTVGQQVCQAEGVCRCIYSPGGTMTRDPVGYRWDCNLLYGKCAPGSAYPVLARNTGPGPDTNPANRNRREIVSSIQQDLKRLGFDPGPVDGVDGGKTKAAIKRYEESAGLPVTGNVSPLLADRLRTAQPLQRR